MSKSEFETTPCLVCGAPDYAPRYQLQDWAYELPGEFQLVTCTHCGHLYQNPRPTQAVIGRYYPGQYQPFWQAIDDAPHAWQRWLGHRRWQTRCRQVSQVRSSGRLLDVGAATGVFLSELRRYGQWDVRGVELSTEAAHYAAEKFGLEVFAGQLEDAPWAAHSFDVITCWDVLEHLPNPHSALQKMRTLLTDEGYLIFSVPNGGSVDAKVFGRYWIGLDQPRHMSVFTLDALRRLLEATGFKIESAYCFYGRYTAWALSVQIWLHARLRPSRARRILEAALFLPVWRYLTLPYFWTIDQLKRGSIITIRARPTDHA